MNHSRILWFFVLFVFVGLFSVAMPSGDVKAYLTNQCFAIQYLRSSKLTGETIGKDGSKTTETDTSVLTTDKICLDTTNNKYLRVGAMPKNASKKLDMPVLKLKIENKKGVAVRVEYCTNGSNYNDFLTHFGCSGAIEEGKTAIDVKNGNVDGGKAEKSEWFYFKDYDYNIEKLAKKVYSVVSGLGGSDNLMDGKFEILPLTDNTTTGGTTTTNSNDSGNDSGNGSGGTSSSGDVTETCANQGGAQSLGWIVCPILTWMGNASDDLYNKYVEPALQVDPKLFTSTDSGLEKAWGTFQNIANIIFVILLLLVIFSQLTGVGIDNYGIKKILPKLIVSAILINLSYVICMIAVDLSNILGNGFQALFDGLADGLTSADSIDVEGTEVGLSSVKGTLASVAVLGSVVIASGAMWKNPAIPMALLVSALGVLISIVFLFLLLSAREAAIIVLTVISPVAVVCYMLPNTKKFFDRWLKIFEGLLLVYPICGLLVGGGNYVANLLLTAGFASSGFISAFTAMIAGIVPVFFIPMVLKNSFAAFGSIGARIAGMGDRLGTGVTRGIRGTEGYKSLQKRGYQRKTRINAGLNADGSARRSLRNSIAGTRFGRAIGYQNLQGARIAAARKAMAEDVEFGAALGDLAYQRHKQEHPEQSDDEYYEGLLSRAAASGNQNEIMTALAQMDRSNMQDSHKADVARRVLGDRANFGNMGAAQIRDTLENVGKQYGNGFLKKDFELKNYAMRGGVGNNGAQNVDGWAQANLAADDLKDEDVLALSTERRAELMDPNVGVINSAQSQRIWASNANMDTGARLQLGVHGNEGTVLSKNAVDIEMGNKVGVRRYSKEQFDAYTEAAPTDTVIRDVRWKDKQGQHQQTDTLEVHQNPTSTPPRP